MGVDLRQNRQSGAVSGEIGIQTLVGPDGVTRYVVQLPGTESWALTPGPTARDLGTDLHTMAGGTTVYLRGVEQAMAQAGIAPDAPVILVGHSQGGMTAAALAADPSFRSGYHHLAVVTAGAPIARFDIPQSVQVLALENRHDLVPHLDGLDNPDRPNVTTLTFDASKGSIGANHDLGKTSPSQPAPCRPATRPTPPGGTAWKDSSTQPAQAAPSPTRSPGGPAHETFCHVRRPDHARRCDDNGVWWGSRRPDRRDLQADQGRLVLQMNSVADTVERTVWLSHLDPLGTIGIGVGRVGRPPFEVERLWQSDREPWRIKYGPRPDGLQ